MKKQMVYDWPTRIFHWSFATLFIFTFVVAKTVDDDSVVFTFHMLAGMSLGFLVLLRLLWGLVGTRYARLSSFDLNPNSLVDYFRGILTGQKKIWAGHNPASSWAALVMMALALGLAITGALMTQGYQESLEDLHELLANAFLITALSHLAGLALHVVRHQDALPFSMISGQKQGIEPHQGISKTRPFWGVVAIVLILSFGTLLVRNFDAQNQTLNFLGKSWQLGEPGGEEDE